jgi:hypothetical protein
VAVPQKVPRIDGDLGKHSSQELIRSRVKAKVSLHLPQHTPSTNGQNLFYRPYSTDAFSATEN